MPPRIGEDQVRGFFLRVARNSTAASAAIAPTADDRLGEIGRLGEGGVSGAGTAAVVVDRRFPECRLAPIGA